MAEEIKKENTEEAAPEAAETEPAEKTDGKAKKKEKKLENEIEALKAELAKKEAEVKEQNEKYLRVVAEYDNFRKRSKAERDGVYADAEKLAEGVRLTAKSFTDALEKLGVTEIEAKTFDPSLHNAVMHVEDETKGDGEIVEVFQKGYKKGDKVIRYAMVKSAN